jgi:hypothetical protein
VSPRSPRNAADGLSAIEERNRLVVLELSILDNEFVPWVVPGRRHPMAYVS